ncbi:MAG: phenylalanine--tRNA ligase subunit beta [Chlamydiota bacterium]
MKLPLSWLKEYVEIEHSPEEVAHLLTMAGLEVDAVEYYRPPFTGVVVGEVLETTPHPDADKLCQAKVFDGQETHDLICGAPNCRPGLRTAFAKVGGVLKDAKGKDFKIKKSKIRGIESYGMLCSGSELQLTDEHNGILELGTEYPLGADLSLQFSEVVFEISLTPNLGHCNSVLGIAREFAALTGSPLKIHPSHVVEDEQESIHKLAQVLVEDRQHCLRYGCRVLKDVCIGPSPLWLQTKLMHCGVRSVNNVVDITNLVMMELGQPIHAFDYDLISGHQVTIRAAKPGEKLITLDGVERSLNEESLLICDHEKPLALAGIMGGENSEVTDSTANVLIEAAYFEPTNIRRTSKALGVSTESSKRFERGVDPNNVIEALDKVAELINTLAGGKVAQGVIDIKEVEFHEKVVTCRLSRINKILGMQLAVGEIQDIFKRLQFFNQWDGDDTFSIRVPSFRHDIQQEIDLIEEVVRVYGYENIPKDEVAFSISKIPHAPIYLLEKEVRQRLIAEGLQDFINCDLISPSQAELWADNSASLVKIINPTSTEQSVLRPSLLPGLLEVIKHNFHHDTYDVSGFEVGRIHYKAGDDYYENSMAAIVLTGNSSYPHWSEEGSEVDFFSIKGIVENLFAGLELENLTFKRSQLPVFHPGRQASIFKDEIDIGVIGELHPALLSQQGVGQRIFFAEINLDNILKMQPHTKTMEPLPQYPGSERDWTITIKEDLPIQDIIDIMEEAPSKLLKEVSFVGQYYDEQKVGSGWKNVTFNMLYRSDKKTVSLAAVEKDHAKVVSYTLEKLEKKDLIRV